MRIRPVLFCVLLTLTSLNANDCQAQQDNEPEVKVLIRTTAGDIRLKLFNGTPLHRDNFIKLIQEHYYDSLLFHRVIRDFMIQAGDPDSRTAERFAPLGQGGPGYTIRPELNPAEFFHRRGALCAARKPDEANPELLSSGSQFYIVTGKKYRAYQLHALEGELNEKQRQKLFTRLWTQYSDSVFAMEVRNDEDGKYNLRKALAAKADSIIAGNGPIKFSQAQMDAYISVGGLPELDGDYTVFGQVTEGMPVVEKIERAMTDVNDRPIKDIRIISARIEE